MSELSDREKKISKVTIWVWRNLLASGVFLVCFGFVYNKLNDIDRELRELKTEYKYHDGIARDFWKRDRGDFGYEPGTFAYSGAGEEQLEEDEKKAKLWNSATEHINRYLDGDKYDEMEKARQEEKARWQ